MTRVGVALGVGLTLMVIAIGVTLTRSPPIVASSDFTPVSELIRQTYQGSQACQAGEMLPQGTTAVRLSLFSFFGPRVTVRVLSGDHLLTSGVRGSGWSGRIPTVPLQPLDHSFSNVKLCFTLGWTGGTVNLDGRDTQPAEAAISEDGQPLAGRMRVEYLRPGSRSWWSLVTSVARRMGLGHWAAGTWIVLLEVALMAAIVAGASWLTVRELR